MKDFWSGEADPNLAWIALGLLTLVVCAASFRVGCIMLESYVDPANYVTAR